MRTKPLFESTRTFSLFSYNVSHGLLLFRSGKTAQDTTRIDILIQDVRAMEIRVWSKGLEFNEVQADFLKNFPSNPVEMVEIGNKVYAVSGTGWQGYIVGGILSVREDSKTFMERSGLLGQPLTGNGNR